MQNDALCSGRVRAVYREGLVVRRVMLSLKLFSIVLSAFLNTMMHHWLAAFAVLLSIH